ncbi:MAG: hypothetical protein RL693_1967 [Verrucomicrobiota bacterium]|jgi:hypothetical protein
MNDDELQALIRQAHPKPEFSSSFQRDVWARIAVVEQQSWATQWQQWSESLFRWVAQPAPAVALVLTMLIVGAGFGRLTTPDSETAALHSTYAASINPVTAAHLAHQK